MLNDFFFVIIFFWVLCLLEFWKLLSANNYDTLIKVVEDVFEIISFKLTLVPLLEYSLAVTKNACHHLKGYTTVHQIKENHHKPVGLSVKVYVKSSTKVNKKNCVVNCDLNQVIT